MTKSQLIDVLLTHSPKSTIKIKGKNHKSD